MAILGGFIVPHPPIAMKEIGRGQEKQIQKTLDAYRLISKEIEKLHPDTIVISTPHHHHYADYIHVSPGTEAVGTMSAFGHHDLHYQISYDEELVKAIDQIATSRRFPAGSQGERSADLDHGFMVPLSFLQEVNPSVKYVRISLSSLSAETHYEMGKLVAKAADQIHRRIVFVASGDMSHTLKKEGPYGFRQEGVDFDKEILDLLKQGDVQKMLSISPKTIHEASQCGIDSFRMMFGALDGVENEPTFFSYECPFGVGYAVLSYLPKNHSDNSIHENKYTALARASISTYLTTHHRLQISQDIPECMTQVKKAVFVSLHRHHRLRGCIGTMTPMYPSLAEEIIENAISAATRDPRFPPLQLDELEDLEISVDVLEAPEKVGSILELDAKKYGVIVSHGYRHGVLLPDLEGVNSPDEQIAIALRKAGISEEEPFQIERFCVTRHHQEDLS